MRLFEIFNSCFYHVYSYVYTRELFTYFCELLAYIQDGHTLCEMMQRKLTIIDRNYRQNIYFEVCVSSAFTDFLERFGSIPKQVMTLTRRATSCKRNKLINTGRLLVRVLLKLYFPKVCHPFPSGKKKHPSL